MVEERKRKVVSTMTLFETKLFKCYVDLNSYIYKDTKVTKQLFEKFVKNFESNVNYNIGAYFTSDAMGRIYIK